MLELKEYDTLCLVWKLSRRDRWNFVNGLLENDCSLKYYINEKQLYLHECIVVWQGRDLIKLMNK